MWVLLVRYYDQVTIHEYKCVHMCALTLIPGLLGLNRVFEHKICSFIMHILYIGKFYI